MWQGLALRGRIWRKYINREGFILYFCNTSMLSQVKS